MADKKKKNSGWNSLSSSQKSDFKAANFDKSIKVSEATIQGLREGKTFEGNVAKFKSGATAEQREAMNRFYGKNRVGAALGDGVSNVNKTYPSNSYNIPNKTTNNPGPDYKGAGSTNYKPPKKSGPGFGSMAGDFVKNEFLGVDDFSRTVKYAKQGNIGGAIKSGLTGSLELGTTAATIVGSVFTGGAVGGAVWGAKAAAYGAKAAAKQGAKEITKQGTKGAGKVVKTVATGSIKNAPATVKKTASAVKGMKVTVPNAKATAAAKRAAVTAATAEKNTAAFKKAASANRSAKSVSNMATKGVTRASENVAKMEKGVKGKYATQGELSTARGALNTAKKTSASISKSAAKTQKSGSQSAAAARQARLESARAKNRVVAMQKKKEAAKATGKAVRRGARRAQYVHFSAAAITRNGNK